MASQRREVTLLVIPPNEHSTWRLRLSTRSVLAGIAAWTLLTLWTGIMAARHLDYVAIRADHKLMRAKVAFLAQEVAQTREAFDRAQETDRRLRAVLALPTRRAMYEAGENASVPLLASRQGGAGGPAFSDRLALLPRLQASANLSPEEVQRNLEALREQSTRNLASFGEISDYLARKGRVMRATPTGWPSPGRVTSNFGYRLSPIDDEEAGEFHPGLDIANAKGTPIAATADGKVAQAGWTRGYGRMVMIAHGEGFTTLFGHASELLVTPGQRVKRGDVIARMGSTGRSTGSHVHYEIWLHGKPSNPKRFLQD